MAIYYCDAANTGGDGSEGDPWDSIDTAMNNVAFGDKVWVKGGTDYAETVSMDTVGLSSSWITFEGYTTTIGDGGNFTIDAAGETYGLTETLGTSGFYLFCNMIINGASSHGVYITTCSYFSFHNCAFTNNGGAGITGALYCTFTNCDFSNNSDVGSGTWYSYYSFCTFYTNGGDGANCGSSSAVVCYSEFYNNTGWYAFDGSGGKGLAIINCTVDGADDSSAYGTYFITYYPSLLINSIMYDLNIAILGTPNVGENIIGANNLIYSTTTDYTQWPERAKDSDITGSTPGFTDEVGGDYTLASDSAARNAGADASGTNSPGMDIGAHQSEDEGVGKTIIIG